jgi:hypothetical protein
MLPPALIRRPESTEPPCCFSMAALRCGVIGAEPERVENRHITLEPVPYLHAVGSLAGSAGRLKIH